MLLKMSFGKKEKRKKRFKQGCKPVVYKLTQPNYLTCIN